MSSEQKDRLVENLLSFVEYVVKNTHAARDSEIAALPQVAQVLIEIRRQG